MNLPPEQIEMKVIAIMRPAHYIADSVKLASSMGFSTITAPMIDVIDKKDPDFVGFLERVMDGESDYVIFTSVNGVEFTLLKLRYPDDFIERLNRINVVAIGPKTKEALRKNGIHVSLMPEEFSSTGIIDALSGIEGAVVEIARSSHGAQELVRGLLEKGAIVHETQVYQIISPRDERHDKFIKLILAGEIDIFPFTSSMMVRNFMALSKEKGKKDEIIDILNRKMVAAIGKPTYDTLMEYGVNVSVVPKRYTFEDLLKGCRDAENKE